MREGSQNSSAGTLSARYRNPSRRLKVRDRLEDNDGNVFGRLGHRRQSAFDRLSDTYSLSITKSGPDRTSFRDHSYSRGRPHRRDSSLSRDHPRSRDRSHGIEESYGNTCSSYKTRVGHRHHSRDRGHSRIMKVEGKVNPHYLAYRRAAPVMEDTGSQRTARVWFDELPPKSIDGYKDLKAAFLAYFMQQKKYIKDPVKIHNIKQKDGETIKDFIERFKVETGCMKGAPECMRISGFMHGINNPELTKRPNEHVPKTMEEMMRVTTSFIRGETAAASKKKGHAPWKL
ncbi:reverse transcriptase domain-containing protein [Tanacetum coccineum]